MSSCLYSFALIKSVPWFDGMVGLTMHVCSLFGEGNGNWTPRSSLLTAGALFSVPWHLRMPWQWPYKTNDSGGGNK